MEIFSADVVGYKNKVKKKTSQDYVDYKFIDGGLICTVADGHSTDFFTYSSIGARLACKVAIEVVEKIGLDFDKISTKIKNGEIQREIYSIWMQRVNDHYKKIQPVVYKTEYLKYSTTLLVAVITEEYRIYLKIGDGTIVEKKNNRFNKILDLPPKHIVDSLGRDGAFINMVYDIRIKEDDEDVVDWVIIFTDGYENSYNSNEVLFESLQKTITKYSSNIFSKTRLKNNYKNFLSKLSKDITHDDISIIFVEVTK